MAMTIDELRGLLQPSQDDQQQTRGMGLLSMGAGILANNRGNYGAFGPAVGAGVQQGLNTYQDAQKTNQNNRLQQISMQMKLDEYQQQQEAAARKLAWQNSVPTGQTTTTQIPSATQAAGLGLTDPSIPTPMNNGLPQLPQTRTTTSQPTREELNNWIVKGIALDPSSAEHAAQVMRYTKPEAAAAPEYNKPFNIDGTPNMGYQKFELDLRRASRAQGDGAPKAKYEASNNSWIYPPDAQHPNGQVIPAGAGGQPTNNLSGDDLLKSLPKPEADQIKALAEGRMPFPAGFALKSPYWQDKISKVSQYDPNFDAVNYNARSQTRNDFVKGKSADNVTALNTAIQHLGKLKESYDKLGNSDYPDYNNVANWVGNKFGNQKVQKNYAAVATESTAVAHELAKVFRQSGMSESEIKDWENKISTGAAPSSSDQTILSAIDLMDGRLQALGARYNQGMGTTKQPYQLLTPEAQNTWNKLRGKEQQSAPASNVTTSGW